MVSIKDNEHKRALFKCQKTGLVGVYVGTKEAQAPNHNKDAVKVVYIPLVDLNKSGIRDRWKGVTEYEELWEVTNTKYPKDAMIGPDSVSDSNAEEGIFSQQVVMPHDIDGRATWQEDFVGKKLQARIDDKDARIKELEKKLGNKEIDKLTQGDNSEVNDKKKGGQRSSRRRENLDFIENESGY